MTVLALAPADMDDFKVAVERDKDGKGRVLKSKFTVRFIIYFLLLISDFDLKCVFLCPMIHSFYQLFNTGIESFLAQQGEWRVSASGLRQHLSDKLLHTVLPVYTQFFSVYSTTKFSKKHSSMYLRFPPQDVERIFKTFFGKI